MKNQKGFTIIELLTSFTLATVVLVFLFNILVIVKENYLNTSIKSELVLQQSLLSDQLNYDAMEYTLVSATGSGGNYTFTFRNDSGAQIQKTLKVTSNSISYSGSGNEFYYQLVEEASPTIQVKKVNKQTQGGNYSYLTIDISITSSLFENQDFGVKAVYLYNTAGSNVTLSA